MRIELIGFETCPGLPLMRDRLAVAASALGLSVSEIDVRRLSPSDPRRGWGSPTVLVDGVDLMGLDRSERAGLCCRLYPGGAPGSDEIARRLASAMAG